MPQTAEETLASYLQFRNLKFTRQRRKILEVFLSADSHLTTEELHQRVRARYPEIGHTTVFRTLKLLEEAGIARSVDFGDKRIRYEREYHHAHHDHLICRGCGRSIEVMDPEIERLQRELCRRNGFRPEAHRLEIFGLCASCIAERSNEDSTEESTGGTEPSPRIEDRSGVTS